MADVDDRVVRMVFENAAFEKKVATTLGTIGELNTAISNMGTKSGLAELSKADKSFNFGGMASAIEGISGKFLALSTIGITALANITNRAIDAGIQLGKSLSLDQVMDGFAEYELNMNSIQTILANTRKDGTTLEQVNGALDELNTYSDQTIYNFAQMTKNIGSATAAGVDLDTAVSYVKGFANSAAVAGVDAGSMAGALEQMSQALGSGVIKAQDWISLEKRGLAGQVQQEAFFNMAKAMGTLADVPLDQSFEDWQAAGNTLRGSLADGWLTADVFLNTMGAFAGEMDEAKLAGLGFSEEMIPSMLELGEVGIESATKVRTLTQLVDTVKEAIASGWSTTFRTVFGDFEEATELFSGLSDTIGDAVGRSADARNSMLQDWKDLGGRTALIDGLKSAFQNLGEIFAPIRKAFRTIFPPMTGERLFAMTEAFQTFAENLKPAKPTVEALGRIFTGFFNVVKIGITVIKTIATGIGRFIKELTGIGQGNALEGLAKVGDFLAGLDAQNISNNILDFFDNLTDKVKDLIPIFGEVKDAIFDFFKGLDFSGFGEFFGSIGGAVGGISFDTSVFDKIAASGSGLVTFGKKVGDIFGSIADVVGDVWDKISEFFGNFGSGIEDAAGEVDLTAIGAIVGGGALAAIANEIRKLVKNGLNIDFGGGFMESITGMFGELNGVLKAMQADLKASALLKIALALGALTASIVVLSTIDAANLAKALTAISVGFGQLVAAFAIISKLSFGPKDTAKMVGLAVGLGLLAGAILLLSLSAKVMSTMNWEELAKGLLGTAGLLAMMIGVSHALGSQVGAMTRAGAGMIVIAGGLLLLGAAMKIFAGMEWEEMAKGFTGVMGGLIGIGVAMRIMPKDMGAKTAGMIGMGLALVLMAGAMKLMATLSWEELAKGLAGVAGGMLAIALAMKLMPPNMAGTATTLIAVGIAMLLLGKTMETFSQMSWGEIARGLVSVTATLGVLALAVKAMQGSIAGAGGLLLLSFAFSKLADVILIFNNIPFGSLLKGLLGMAVAMGVLGGMAYLLSSAVVPMLAFGAGLMLLGAGFALFGLGASLGVAALAGFIELGPGAAKALTEMLKAFGAALPALATGLALGIGEFIKVIGGFIPEFVTMGVDMISALLQGLTKILPDVFDFISELIGGIIDLIEEKVPEYVEMGLNLLMALLQGIADNIGEVVTTVALIITNFLDAMAEAVPDIISSLVELWTSIFLGLAEGLGKVAGTLLFGVGIAFVTGLFNGITKQIKSVKTFWNGFPGKVLSWIGNVAKTIWDKGVDLIGGLLGGILRKAKDVIDWFGDLPGNVLKWIGNVVRTLWNKGVDFVAGLLGGIVRKAKDVINWFKDLPGNVVRWIGNVVRTLWNKGVSLLAGLYNGIYNRWTTLRRWISDIPNKILSALGSLFRTLKSQGTNLIKGLWNGIVERWNALWSWFRGLPGRISDAIGSGFTTLSHIGKNLIAGLKNGIISVWDSFSSWIWEKAKEIPGKFIDAIPIIGGPTKFSYELGMGIMEGFALGISKMEHSPVDAADVATKNITGALMAGVQQVNDVATMMERDISPTIRPVIDISNVEAGARRMSTLLDRAGAPKSTAYASAIAAGQPGQAQVMDHTSGTTEIKFEQTINAPKQLSTGDIYRQTRNQIAMAREELSIP